LDLVKCQILNCISNEYCDAYLLSESSLFVYPYRIVLKTCGTTLLLNAVQMLLTIAEEQGLREVENVFYTRRKFFFPHKQLWPHTSWKSETRFLDTLFHGCAYVLGKVNGDHWYLYMTEDSCSATPPVSADQTLEIMMTDLNSEKMKHFIRPSATTEEITAREVTIRSGIANLFPGALLDDFLFNPMGYSINGLVGEAYFTIHITPQPKCSYVSFETNIGHKDYSLLVRQVLSIFDPDKFTLLFFANDASNEVLGQTVDSAFEKIDGCVRSEDIDVDFETYHLSYCQYHRLVPTNANGKGDISKGNNSNLKADIQHSEPTTPNLLHDIELR